MAEESEKGGGIAIAEGGETNSNMQGAERARGGGAGGGGLAEWIAIGIAMLGGAMFTLIAYPHSTPPSQPSLSPSLPTTSGDDELTRAAAHYNWRDDGTPIFHGHNQQAPTDTKTKTPTKPGDGTDTPPTQTGGGTPPIGGGPPSVTSPAYSEDDGCGCGGVGRVRTLFHGTTWNGADDILTNGIHDPGRANGDPDFYTTPSKQLAADFSGNRTMLDDPYRAILRFDVPESVLETMKAGGTATESVFLNSDQVEVRFKPGSWTELMEYLTEVNRITGPTEEGC